MVDTDGKGESSELEQPITEHLVGTPEAKFIDRLHLRQWAVLLVVTATATYSIMYTSLQHFTLENVGGSSDAIIYMKMAKGESFESRRSKMFRVLTPTLVKALPDPPRWAFSTGRTITEDWLIQVKFALVNGVFVIATGLILAYYLSRLGFSFVEIMIGVLLFLTSLTVVHMSTIPLVEASLLFFVALGAVAIVSGSAILLGIALIAGLFAKETAILLVPLALLARPSLWRWWILAALPGVGLYLLWRVVNTTSGNPDLGHLDPDHLLGALKSIPSFLRFNYMMDLFFAFGLLWVPALYALFTRRLPTLLSRSYWWVLLLLVIALLLGVGFGRTLFLAFPIVIPSALIGLRRLWQSAMPAPSAL